MGCLQGTCSLQIHDHRNRHNLHQQSHQPNPIIFHRSSNNLHKEGATKDITRETLVIKHLTVVTSLLSALLLLPYNINNQHHLDQPSRRV
jgi:hypothetical protein